MTYKKKLIEVALPLSVINDASRYDKALKYGHPDNLHQWWARRPLPAARAVIWASLVDDPSVHVDRFPTEAAQDEERQRLLALLSELVDWNASDNEEILGRARHEIQQSCGGDLPNILDPFGGGGSIPLEAARLGLPTFSGDLNPVAVTIQRAMMIVPQRFSGCPPVFPGGRRELLTWSGTQGLAADVDYFGRWMRDTASGLIGEYFESDSSSNGSQDVVIAWIWARTVKSPDPAFPGYVPLVRSWVVSKKPKRPVVWVEPIVDATRTKISYEIREGGEPNEPTIDGGVGRCVATGAPIPTEYIRQEALAGRMRHELLAVAVEGSGARGYRSPTEGDRTLATSAMPAWRPRGSLPPAGQGLGFRVQAYGLDEWHKLFTQRQLLALTTFSDLLGDVHDRILEVAPEAGFPDDDRPLRDGGRGPRAYADAVVTYLSFVIDKVADLNNALAVWKLNRECPVHLFGRQAIPMSWDFPEANPFSSSSGSWLSSLKGVVAAVASKGLAQQLGDVDIQQRDARSRVREVGPCVVCTDPPYYDNVGYADLSDFFFVWLRHNLRDIWPDECATLVTPKADELIADPGRAGSRQAAHQFFESGMGQVFDEVVRGADDRFPSTIFYAFKASETTSEGHVSTGWETFLGGMLSAGLMITATWPMRTEGVRLRSIGSNALASSIVLACRPRPVGAPMATRSEFLAQLREEMAPAIRLLQRQGIAPVDLAQSAMGPGIAVFSRFSRVVEADGSTMSVRAALALVNEVLAEVLSGEESEFDPDSRFALTWFEQYGHGQGPYGDAATLARAKNTSVDGIAQAGIIQSRDGKVRLLERSQLSATWDPVTDARLTVWETTQHLIRALDESEMEAAGLLARIGGGMGERARQLAYLLYGLCDRKKWADEAGAYNMLVTAWPEITRLAAAGPQQQSAESLF